MENIQQQLSLRYYIKITAGKVREAIETLNVKSSFLRRYIVPIRAIRCIDIEPIAACNLKCDFCQVPGWNRADETQPMDIELFKKIINQIPNLKSIKLQGMGEPFLNPNLTEMIKIASDRNINTDVVTNGSILNPKLINKVLDANLTELSFSFDGATKKTYENLRRNSSYNKVINNIKLICELKKQKKVKTIIKMICLVSNEDVLMEIPALVKLASQLGVDSVNIKKRLKIWKKTDKKGTYDTESVYLDSNRNFKRVMSQAKNLARELGIKLEMVADPEYSPSNPCLWPWKSLYVSTEGKIVPCCALGVPEVWSMGDLRKEELKDIWNNKTYKELRRRISLDQIPKTCGACYRT